MKNINTKRAYIVINKKNIIFNIKSIKKHINNKMICAVVKDNAYGHNAINIAKIIKKYVEFFGVSTIEEAINLNKETNKKILILGHIENSHIKDAINNNIRMTISNFNQAKIINNISKKMNKKSYIHIAINTGMNRIGFSPNEETKNQIIKICNMKNINVEGIFSHYSVADIYDEKNMYKKFTLKQKKIFDNFIDILEQNNILFKYKHIANSAGTLLSLYDNTNLVRPGIILYGIYPSETITKNIKLKPILSLYSKIVHIKNINKNEYISYGNTFKSKNNMTIATVSIGYGDGYPRSINNKQQVIINGVYCNVVGRVTMDQLMVDVSNIKCKIGDKVILIGEEKNKQISIYNLSKNSNILHYELLCNLNHRLPIYYK